MAPFFIPGVDDDVALLESAYGDMRKQIEADMGRRPNPRRILRLWTRHRRLDFITEVGKPDPLHGGMVMAIFDMGSHQPFVVWRQSDDARHEGVREVLSTRAYAVLEFDS